MTGGFGGFLRSKTETKGTGLTRGVGSFSAWIEDGRMRSSISDVAQLLLVEVGGDVVGVFGEPSEVPRKSAGMGPGENGRGGVFGSVPPTNFRLIPRFP